MNLKHFVHVYDAGCVEVQRLVERPRSLPSRKGVYDAGRSPRGGSRACSVQEKARLESGRRARVECTSNISAMTLTLDVSKFTGWLKAFASCRVKRGEYVAGRSPRGGSRALGRACSVQEKARLDWV